MDTIEQAAILLKSELWKLALNINDEEREAFFDPRNRNAWMDAYIAHLQKRYQQPDRFASND